MSNDNNSISIKNVGKCYKIYPSRNARLKEWLVPFAKKRHEEKWVLKDINIEVAAGEAVGIIGMNGAGKSTLLKIITGTTVPTTGSVHFNGRVSALLELGLGFHPDFTGRQNVYMSGQLLGYTIDEINECMEQVEEFAEIGNAIDAPVRTYSSGMQVRLAFSVATMKRPDILIVDEALSVGDSYFQHKSFGRIKEFCDKGTTLLLVSHDAAAIQAVCDRAVLLDHGQVLKIGKPQEIMDYYNAMIGGNGEGEITQESTNEGNVRTVSGSRDVTLEKVVILDESGKELKEIAVGSKVRMEITAKVNEDLPALNCGFSIKDNIGQIHYGTNTRMHNQMLYDVKYGSVVTIRWDIVLNIGEGNYSISTAFVGGGTHTDDNFEWTDYAYVFQIINVDKKPFSGYSYLPCSGTVEIVR